MKLAHTGIDRIDPNFVFNIGPDKQGGLCIPGKLS